MRVFDSDDREDDSVRGLIQLCTDFIESSMVMAEIGCFRGVSTAIFARFAKTVHAVDPWTDRTDYADIPKDMMEKAEAEFDKTVRGFHNIVKHKGFSTEIAKQFGNSSLDAVYIDADHSSEAFQNDISAWTPKVKLGGFIMGHDYRLVGGWLPFVRTYPDQSWVYQKL